MVTVANKAKAASINNGQLFLREALAAEQELLKCQLELSSKSITHNGVMGDVNEEHFIEYLRKHLPGRYQVDRGIVIDSNGATSDQIDVIIFDRQYTPTLLDQHHHRFIPAEAVYCVLEVKPSISKEYLEYAGAKANSVRKLMRTSIPIPHAGGLYDPKPLFPIVAGIIGARVSWADGLESPSFASNLASLSADHCLDCGVALADKAFDENNGQLDFSPLAGSLAWFLFRLLQRLQSLGTVPAVDWNKYAGVLSGTEQ